MKIDLAIILRVAVDVVGDFDIDGSKLELAGSVFRAPAARYPSGRTIDRQPATAAATPRLGSVNESATKIGCWASPIRAALPLSSSLRSGAHRRCRGKFTGGDELRDQCVAFAPLDFLLRQGAMKLNGTLAAPDFQARAEPFVFLRIHADPVLKNSRGVSSESPPSALATFVFHSKFHQSFCSFDRSPSPSFS